MKKEDRRSMWICFILGIVFSVSVAYGVLYDEIYNFFESRRHRTKMITSAEHPVYFWLIISTLGIFAALFLNSAFNYWQDRNKEDERESSD